MRCLPLLLLLLLATVACTGTIVAPTPGGSGSGAGGSTGTGGGDDLSGAPGIERSAARRLSRTEVTRTLVNVFGAGVPVAVTQLPDENLTPFDNDVQEQAASMRLVEGTEAIGIEVADWVTSNPSRLAAVLPCTPANATDAACFTATAEKLALQLLRHPLEPAELTDALTLLGHSTSGGTFAGAVKMLIRTLILHPGFLYRTESNTLTAYEIATRLSLLLVGAAPDDALLAAAQDGSLLTEAGRRAQAERLVTSEPGKQQQRRFVAMWLGYSRMQQSGLELKMRAESDALVDRAFASDLSTLFSSDDTFVDAELAAHYGLTGASATPAFVPYGSTERRGILSHGAFAIAGAKFSDTSPTRRGKFIRERLFCQVIKLPEANVDVDQPPKSNDPNACKVDRYVQHRTDVVCAGCHAQTDPLGFGLENLDQLGRWRTHDEGRPECAISGDGRLDANTPFNGPKQLGALVATDSRVAQCLAQHLIRFSEGRGLQPGDEDAARWLAANLRHDGNNVRAMLLAYVAHPNFALRKEEP